MPRDYDDDDDRPRRRRDDDDDDRPRRRRYDRPPPRSSSGTGMVLLIVGLVVGLPLLGVAGLVCAGAFFAAAARAPGGNMNSAMAEIEAEVAAEEFLDELKSGNTFGAYQSTSTRYQGITSQAQFDRTVKANPALTTPNTYSQIGTTSIFGTSPNRNATLSYNVEPFGGGAAPPRAVTCTVKVAEQPDGTWKVDGFSVP